MTRTTTPQTQAGKTALITGASSGIGAELANCFAAGGFDLVLVARSEDKLKSLAADLAQKHGIQAYAVPVDLAQPGSAAKLSRKLHKDKLAVDVMVNCAGVLEHGQFIKMPPKQHQNMIDLNLSALTAMLATFIPPMVERGHGRILNVASIAAFQPIPSLATYAATKAYVLSLTESLAEELKGTGVSVTALCPGITATPMMTGAENGSPSLKVPGFLVGNAEQVAAEGYEACMQGDVIRVPGAVNLATTLASRATPKWLLRQISGMIGRKTARN
jgi:short-subunit dehydrogenase